MKNNLEISVKLFGRPEITNLPSVVFPAKGFLLLAVLSCEPNHRMQRNKLANLLWDSSSDAEALVNLRQLLRRIRHHRGQTGDLLAANGSEILLGDAADAIDLYKFVRLRASENSEELLAALHLFQSDLLVDVAEPTDSFSQWLSVERTAVRESFFSILGRALVELTRYGSASSGDLARLKDRVIEVDPEREESYRAFIDAFGRNGMYREARELYHALILMLDTEHDERPSPETEAVKKRVFAAASGMSVLTPARPEIHNAAIQQPRVAMLSVSDPAGVSNEGLVDALMEDVANELSRYRTFVILAPHSSQKVSHTSGIPNSNDLLKADYTISGFVKPGDAGVTLAIRMISCRTANVVWAAEYNAGPEALIRTFRVLSAQIASSLAAELEREMLEALKFNSDGKAYLHYLQGQVELGNCTLPALRRARKQFQQALKLDSGFALACGRIAQTLYLEWLMLGGDEPQLLLHARRYSEQAAYLDRGAAIGFWIGGVVDLYQRKFEQSMEQFAEAEALNPNSADIIVQHADALSHFGKAEEGWVKFERAIDLNPMPPDHYWWAGASIAFAQERYDESIDLCNRMSSQEPVMRLLAAAHALAGNKVEARAYGRLVKEMHPARRASEISRLAPTMLAEDERRFIEGLRIAGVK